MYLVEPDDLPVVVERTKSTFEGDYTVVVFPFVKYSRKKPDETAKEIGVYIKSRCEDIASYNVVHGFLNMRMTPDYWINKLNTLCFGPCEKPLSQDGGHTYMVEFS